MKLITLISAASAMVATASARSAVDLNKECDHSQPYARIINRCDYPVYLWSVFKGDGCPADEMVTLEKGDTYSENWQDPSNGVGVSIKMSKTEKCKSNDIVQFEYFLEKSNSDYAYNYLDVSYVDCLDGDCPTKNEGYYLVAGNQTGAATASAGNTWCPILSCHDAVSCAKISYILPDDVQTKTCDLSSSMDFYMCGGDAPSEDYNSAPASSSEQATSSTPSPTSVQDSYTENLKVNAAAVTNAPDVKEVEKQQKTKTQFEVVYATVYEYVNAKRHAHGHARRHQPFHA
ncbi:Nn.00g021850.m01.CDS01 [Neocucurbitaria sp. VM-36]